MPDAALTLPAGPASVPAARRFVTGALAGWGQPEASDTAALLVSELATNAVLHARTAFTVEVRSAGGTLRVSVRDGSPARPRSRTQAADATTGRGLQLLEVLSAAWGTERRPDGKTVWFELEADREPGAPPGGRREVGAGPRPGTGPTSGPVPGAATVRAA